MTVINPGDLGVGVEIRKKIISPSAYGIRKYGVFYYGAGSKFHGIYQVRTRYGKQVQVKEKFYEPSDQTQPAKVARQQIFATIVGGWQGLTDIQKAFYNNLKSPKRMSGYNRYLHYCLLDSSWPYCPITEKKDMTILPYSYNSIGQGTWAFNAIATQFLASSMRNTTQNNGDNLTFKIYLLAGTYTFLLFTVTGASRGIVDIDIDGNEVASFDNYHAAGVKNVRNIETGIVIATSGLKTLTLRMDGKNASATAHRLDISYIAFWRTA